MITVSVFTLLYYYLFGVLLFGGIYLMGCVQRGYKVELGDLILPLISWVGFLVWFYTFIVDVNHRTGLAKFLSKPIFVPTPYNQKGITIMLFITMMSLLFALFVMKVWL